MPGWLVAVSGAGREGKAAEELGVAGFSFYQPVYRERGVVRGRRGWVTKYLLGRYILVEMVERWYQLLSFIHLSDVLRHDEKPRLARDDEVQRLKNSERRGYVPKPDIQNGARVFIKRGAFVDCYGTYEGKNDGGDDLVLVDVFGRPVRMAIPFHPQGNVADCGGAPVAS